MSAPALLRLPVSLALLLLCSCTCNLHKHIIYRGYTKDKVTECSDKAPLYNVSGRLYVQGMAGPGRGHGKCECGEHLLYSIDEETANTVYVPLSLTSSSQILRGEDHLNLEWAEDLPQLTNLPRTAKSVKSNCVRRYYSAVGGEHMDAHALYALPLGALTAVCVDLPATVLMNVGAAAATVVAGPPYMLYYWYSSHRENKAPRQR